MSCWIKLHRKILSSPLYLAEPFTKGQAWIDLLLLASSNEYVFYKRGMPVKLSPGQIGHDVNYLANRWKWSRGKVDRFILMLQTDNQIVTQKNNITTIISICNWNEYQSDGKANRQPKSKANGHNTKNIYNNTILQFYLDQVEVAKTYLKDHPEVESNVEEYKRFVLFLHDWKNRDAVDPMGNSIHSPLTNVLKMEKQLRFDQFVNHFARAKELGINFYSKLSDMENTPKSIQNKTDLNRTLFNWIKPYVK